MNTLANETLHEPAESNGSCNEELAERKMERSQATNTIYDLFLAQASARPDAIAIESDLETLTYGQLTERIDSVALHLNTQGVEKGAIVGVFMDPCIDAVVAIMAVLRTGAAYLPLGSECPPDRLNLILTDSGAASVLVSRPKISLNNIEVPIVEVGDIPAATRRLPPFDAHSNDLAYVIYTSGTTGRPKGVMIEHSALSNYLTWAAETYLRVDAPEAIPFHTSISFDLTITSIFLPLISGNRILLYAPQGAASTLDIIMRDNKATIVKLTPSHLRLIKHIDLADSSIHSIVAGGEDLPRDLAEDTRAALGGRLRLYNEYGPTEATVGCMIHQYNPENDKAVSVPIGAPIRNTRIYVLNGSLDPILPGQTGEIFIAGGGLSRGYFNRTDLTEASFLADPFYPGERMYRTGDLATQDDGGLIIYKGRIDHQVKVRGFRIETTEIEDKIVEFQRLAHQTSLAKLSAPSVIALTTVERCKSCISPLDLTDEAQKHTRTCRICREFEDYREHVAEYFKTPEDLFERIKQQATLHKGKYDALLCFSGGKDSTYALHRLVESGIKVLAYTFDNGYISPVAFDNMRRATDMLGVDLMIGTAKEINKIFIDSLLTEANVCNGCFKSINTLALQTAWDHGAKFVINGLSRGQIFDINVHGLFKLGIFDEQEIQSRLTEYRKKYFSRNNRVSRLLETDVTAEMVENTEFIDYFRYDGVSTKEVVKYISEARGSWIRPPDTGSSSSNCRLNDASIYFHVKNRGDHFYASQLSWDVRLRTISREEAFTELAEFALGDGKAREVLKDIGYFQATTGACVVSEVSDHEVGAELSAYVVADALMDFTELRSFLVKSLPAYMVPNKFVAVDEIPLSPSGKIDLTALTNVALESSSLRSTAVGVIRSTQMEADIAEVWAGLLNVASDAIRNDDDFFDIGGHSFKYVKMMSELTRRYGVKLKLAIEEKVTIGSLARLVEATQSGA